jgi:SNF2-related domain
MASSQSGQGKIRLRPNDNDYYFKVSDASAPSLAGLLEFSNTKDFGKWLESQDVQALWVPYHDFRRRGFGGIATKAVPLILRDCMDLWKKEDIRELLREDVTWSEIPMRTRPLLVTLWYARRLVMSNPRVFSKFVGFPEGTENIARAVRCLRLMWDRGAKNMEVAPQKNQPAIGVQHFTIGNAPRKPDGTRFLVEKGNIPRSANGPAPLPRRRHHDNRVTDELLKEIEKGLCTSDDSLLGTIQSETIGLDPTTRIAFLKEIAAEVTLLRAGISNASVTRQELVEMAGNVGGIADLSEAEGDTAETETENFWRLQTAIASLSCTNTSSYDDSRQVFSTHTRSGDPMVGDLVLKPWQVIGVKWMLDQEKSPLHGGIIADGCGLGKTNQTLAFLVASIRRDEASPSPLPSQEQRFQPTLIVAPPAVIQTWVDEYTDHFSDQFTMRVFHSGRSQAPWVRDATISRSEAKCLWDEEGIAYSRKRETRRLLLITTYETLARRFQAEESDDSSDADSRRRPFDHNMWVGRFARVICDEGHRIKGRKTDVWAAVSGLQAKFNWILTATPLVNRVTDYLGYLALFFKPEWAQSGNDLDDDNPSQMYRDFLALPLVEQTVENGLHLLDPELFTHNLVLGDMPMERAQHVLPALSRVMQLQRTMASPVDVGGGKTQRIGDTIPPFVVETVELALSNEAQAEYQEYHQALIAQLRRKNPANGDDEE